MPGYAAILYRISGVLTLEEGSPADNLKLMEKALSLGYKPVKNRIILKNEIGWKWDNLHPSKAFITSMAILMI